MYDVIIAGAGPAGCTAAKVLAEKGYRVLLVEKFKMPRYKSCSGILIKKTMALTNLYFGAPVPQKAMCTPVDNRGMIFTNDLGKEYRFEQEGCNVWRSQFDSWLADKARESGAVVRDDTIAVSCEEEGGCVHVTLRGSCLQGNALGRALADGKKTYIETAKYLLDCEGVAGMLKRKIIKNPPACVTTFQTFYEGSICLDPHYFYAYLQPELSGYDAWFNVKDGMLVFGVAVKDTGKIRQFYDRFLAYMTKNHGLHIAKRVKSEKWLMPYIRPGCYIDYGVGRVLFAGEAAGFLNPMGEGISAAMESGYCAACALAQHFENMEMLYADYRERTKELWSYMIRQWSLVGSMAGTFSEMK